MKAITTLFASIFVTLSLSAALINPDAQPSSQSSYYYNRSSDQNPTPAMQSQMNNPYGTPTMNTDGSKGKDRFRTADDQKLGSQLRQQLVEIVGLPQANDIMLVIDGGDVQITGKAPSQDAIAKITQNVTMTKGVKSVTNRLESTNGKAPVQLKKY